MSDLLPDTIVVDKQYKIIKKLESGRYGTVYKVSCLNTPLSIYALKIISKNFLSNKNINRIRDEIKIHIQLDHKNIIKLYRVDEDFEYFYLLMEYADGGDLYEYLRHFVILTEEVARDIIKQMIEAIEYCYQCNVIHRDIKLENILFNKGQIKLCDFGWAYQGDDIPQEMCGTAEYIAPEVISGKLYDYKVDIWSLGIVLYEILYGDPPFDGDRDDDKTFQLIIGGNLIFPENIATTFNAKDIILSILDPDPIMRMDFYEIKNHPWLTATKDKYINEPKVHKNPTYKHNSI